MEKEYNFGTFRESDGVVIYEFVFINDGTEPLIIGNVTSNCGCTVPSWTSEPVSPGGRGVITVNYDPKDRPGTFARPVTVISNAETPSVTLLVKGVVIPVDLVEEVFRYKIGNLMISTIYASFGEIYKGRTTGQTLKIYNSSGSDSLTLEFPELPAHLRINAEPEILAPLQEGRLDIEYLTNEIDDWDYIVDRIRIYLNGKEAEENLNITANLREDFSMLTSADLKSAPVAGFDSTVFNFGTISQDSSPVVHDFILANGGEKDLYIRKISASCGCTAVVPDITVIQPGGSARIKAIFDPSGQSGSQKKAVTVITNDPRHSKYILWIEGNVGPSTSP